MQICTRDADEHMALLDFFADAGITMWAWPSPREVAILRGALRSSYARVPLYFWFDLGNRKGDVNSGETRSNGPTVLWQEFVTTVLHYNDY